MRINKLQSLLVSNKHVKRPPVEIDNAAADQTIYIYDAIVGTKLEAGYYGGVSAEELVPQIRAIKGGTVNLRINSPGGDVFAAQAIVAAIRDTGATVVAYVDGLAASAATVIATAADRVEMSDGALWMIHCGWTMAIGNATDMRATAALLDKVDATIAKQYADRTGMTIDAVMQLMLAETWLDAQEAVANGFVSAVCAPTKTKAEWDLTAYGKAPQKAPEPDHVPEPAIENATPEHRDYQRRQLRMAIVATPQ